jgi:enoyl-CoA hydratase
MTSLGPAKDIVLVDVADGVMTITLNRPGVRNAINEAMANAIGSALDELDRRSDLLAGVLAGNGPAFCSGMDLKAFLAGERPVVAGRGFAGIAERGSDKPLIAAVEGFAVAGGFEVVLACDLVVAARSAVFALPEFALTGDNMTATRAAELGLVNRLVDDGRARDEAMSLAKKIAANGPLAVRATKQILSRGLDWPAGEFFGHQSAYSDKVRSSADAREGASAFAEKRPPQWRGK